MIKFTIYGEACSKANSRKIVTFGKKLAVIKSDKARDYVASSILQIPSSAKQMIEEDIRFTAWIYYASRRPDLDESVLLDLLQAVKKKGILIRKGVYLNDRSVKEKHIYWGLDKQNPRAEIEIEIINKD